MAGIAGRRTDRHARGNPSFRCPGGTSARAGRAAGAAGGGRPGRGRRGPAGRRAGHRQDPAARGADEPRPRRRLADPRRPRVRVRGAARVSALRRGAACLRPRLPAGPAHHATRRRRSGARQGAPGPSRRATWPPSRPGPLAGAQAVPPVRERHRLPARDRKPHPRPPPPAPRGAGEPIRHGGPCLPTPSCDENARVREEPHRARTTPPLRAQRALPRSGRGVGGLG